MATRNDRPTQGRNVPPSRNAASARSAASSKSSTVHYNNNANGKKMSRKDRKIEKKRAKFKERDLRYYPMTVGKWIGTFILLAIPLINILCCILWFFGVGNKSRAAWIRAHVLRIVIIIVLIVAIIGSCWLVLKNQASKNAGAETPKEVIFYGVGLIADKIAGVAGEETAEMIKEMIAEKLGIPYQSPYNNDGENGNEYEGEGMPSGEIGEEESGDEDYGDDDWTTDAEQAYA